MKNWIIFVPSQGPKKDKGNKINQLFNNIILNKMEMIKKLRNYEPKGQLIGFPKEIIFRMLECQIEQGNEIDISVFEKDRIARGITKGFNWWQTKENYDFWNEVIRFKNFALFFETYPKKKDDNN